MKNIIYKISLLLSVTSIMAFSFLPQQEEAKIILEGIKGFYLNNTDVYQEINYNLYAGQEAKEIHSTELGKLIMSRGLKYSVISDIESLTSKEWTIGIDHSEQTFMISRHYSIPATSPIEAVNTSLDSLASYSIHSHVNNINSLVIKSEYGEIAETEFFYQTDNYQLEKVILKYRREIQLASGEEEPWVMPRLEIVYHKTSLNGKGKELLKLENYVLKNGDDWMPVAKYAGYEFINNIGEFPFKN